MRGIHVGMQEADRDRLDAGIAQRGNAGRDRILIERKPDLTVHVDAFRHREAQRARHQWRRLLDRQIVLVVAALGRDIEHVTKAFRSDQGGARPPSLDDGIGRKRRTVHEYVDVGEMQPRIGEHESRAFERTLLGLWRGRQPLAGQPLIAPIEYDISDRAADINRHANVSTHPQPFRSKRKWNSVSRIVLLVNFIAASRRIFASRTWIKQSPGSGFMILLISDELLYKQP